MPAITPENQKSEKQQDGTIQTISEEEKSNKLSLTMAWWGVCSALFYIFLAATLALNYGTMNTIIGMGLSVIVYGAINHVLSKYAIESGWSVLLFSRRLFGRVGAGLATLIFFLTAIYYAVFEGSVIAFAAANVGLPISYSTACILVVLYSVPLVFGSVQSWLDKLNGVLLPFYILGLLAIVIASISQYGYDSSWLTYEPEGGASSTGWINVFVGYMGVWVLMMFTFDFARFGKKEDKRYHSNFNFGIPFYVMTFFINGLIGIFLVLSGGLANISETGVVDQLIVVLGGTMALLFIWVTQTRINSANFYLASVNMQAFFEPILNIQLKKWMWAVVVGVIVLVMMQATNVFHYILTALTYQGIFVTAWVGVALAYIFKHKQSGMSNSVTDFNKVGLIAWFAGAGIGFIFALMNLPGGAYAPIYTFVISFMIYRLYGVIQVPELSMKPNELEVE